MLGRPRVLAAALCIAAGAATFLARPEAPLDGISVAEARVSIAYTLPLLVDGSPWSVVATPLERKSAWERVEGSRRIVTYTKVRVEQRVYGRDLSAGTTLWVRHLGGAVGKVGQQVAGEAVLPLHEPALLFLSRLADGRYTVSGSAQGHFRLLSEGSDRAADRVVPAGELRGEALEAYRRELSSRHLSLNRSMGKLVRRAGPVLTVQEVLKGKSLADAVEAIRKARAARDADEETSR